MEGDRTVTTDIDATTGAEGLQPWMHDLTVALAAPTQAWCGPDGQVRPGGAQGMFHGDVRVLSRAELTVGGRHAEPVTTVPVAADTVLAVAVARHLGDRAPDPTVRVERRRTVAPGELREDVLIVSSAQETVRTDVVLTVATDLARMDAVKSGTPVPAVTPQLSHDAVAWYGAGDLAVHVQADGAELSAPDGVATATWHVTVDPGGRVGLTWRCRAEDPTMVVTAARDRTSWQLEVDADDRRLAPWVRRSVEDLTALKLAVVEAPAETFLAAGAPWFLTLFGRDSLWAARMLLPLGTELAGSTLRLLASRQGRDVDPETAEEPGKILHELRSEDLQVTGDPGRPGGMVLPPVYYGTVDATALWVSLLHDAWRWGMPVEEVRPLLPAVEAALEWIVGYGDSDGDGFIEYVDSTGRGLSNQGWKDSGDSVRWRSGELADAPIALSEVQGYAYEAAVGGAALLRHFGTGQPDRWSEWAAGLRERFRDRFWVEDTQGAYPAIALDKSKRPVDSLTSNIGHLLGTGLLSGAEETLVAARIVAPDMASGYGLRTLSSRSGGYSPLSYHSGSVWPHDTAITFLGAARCGQTAAAAELLTGLVAAATAFDGRLPELYGGDARADVPVPVPYPAACRPQAWSAASAIAALTALTGLNPDVPAGTVVVEPLVPSPVGALRVDGLRVAGQRVEIALDATGNVVTAPPSQLPQ